MNVFLILCYECCLWILALLAIPKMLYQLVFYKKYRQSLLPRLGFDYPIFQQNGEPLIWIHAVSVGETKAVVSLVRELKQRFPSSLFVVSSITETGHAEAKRSLPFVDYHVYLPFDFSFIVRRLIKRASPDLVILCESDFWFNFMRLAKAQGASLVLVNGKLSEKSTHRFCKVPFFSKALFELFDFLCVQNALYEKRFIEAGASPEKIHITGNLKLDDEYPQLTAEEVTQWRQKLGIQPDQLVLTIGSSHHPEEQLILQLLKEIWKSFPTLKVIFVPRHPERFQEVGELLEKERLLWVAFTDINRRTGKEQAILIDAMGMLRMCYQLSDIAIVGGSFTSKVGGHNILEPCWYSKPVLFGPHMYSQPELVDLIKEYDAGKQVSEEQLQETLFHLLGDSAERQRMGQNGLELIRSLKGSTKRTLHVIDPLLHQLSVQDMDNNGEE
ncbi:3-deoxy-D-manno-octulosonic acid transferase [Candidatus Protochlamydia phocaeensis]|uniref:3-deoxy-D-manno-octulosonic acid transferase n=1 Tax=Candidatus Protochlamydia phocaeensis TaxID=1414722 RepID=UPI00083834CE|nr:3-deoxy-D-manno-octulosonic acid transferase [Candidatus Protochlamydia phocaeensis]